MDFHGKTTIARWLAFTMMLSAGAVQQLAAQEEVEEANRLSYPGPPIPQLPPVRGETGTIERVSHELGIILIGDKGYRLSNDDLMIRIRDELGKIVHLQPGITVNYSTNQGGEITMIEITGPQTYLDELVNR